MKRYRLLKNLPDGATIGDTYKYSDGVGKYYNEKKWTYEGSSLFMIRDVENNQSFFALIPEEKEETKEFQLERDGYDKFEVGVEKLINSNSLENKSDTPDHISAEFIRKVFELFNKAIVDRTKWYGVPPKEEPYHIGIDRNGYETGKDWEIVSIREKHGQFDQLHHIDKYDKKNWDYLLAFLKINSTIHSVKRLSDNEVFSVGDEVEYRAAGTSDWSEIWEGKINKFTVTSEKLVIEIDDNHKWQSNFFPKKNIENIRHKHPAEQSYMKEVKTFTIEDLRKAFEAGRKRHYPPNVAPSFTNSCYLTNDFINFEDYLNKNSK